MKIIKCDRCGKEINYTQGRPVFAVTRTNTGMYMDMCKKCRKALVNFMHLVDDEERPKGEWILNDKPWLDTEGQCSLCSVRAHLIFGVNYCPNCGAYLREEKEIWQKQ